MIGAVHFAEPASADDVRRCLDGILMERLMLSRTPSLILLNAARHTKDTPAIRDWEKHKWRTPIKGVDLTADNTAFWLLYDLALSFRKGCAL